MTRPIEILSPVLTAMMDNVLAWQLASIVSNAGHPARLGIGDNIDRGLLANRLLNEEGFGLVRIEPKPKDPHFEKKDAQIVSENWTDRYIHMALYTESGRQILIDRGWTPPPVEPSADATILGKEES